MEWPRRTGEFVRSSAAAAAEAGLPLAMGERARGGAREPGGQSLREVWSEGCAPRKAGHEEHGVKFLTVVRPLPFPSFLGKLKLILQGPTQKAFLLERLPQGPGKGNPASRVLANQRRRLPGELSDVSGRSSTLRSPPRNPARGDLACFPCSPEPGPGRCLSV